MTTDDKGRLEEERARRDDGSAVRERSAEQRNITAPTPKDVRQKAESGDKGRKAPEPPAADRLAP